MRFLPSHSGFDSRCSGIDFDVAEIYRQWHCLEREDSAKSLIVEQTHLVLINGKLVLQKTMWSILRIFWLLNSYGTLASLVTIFFRYCVGSNWIVKPGITLGCFCSRNNHRSQKPSVTNALTFSSLPIQYFVA